MEKANRKTYELAKEIKGVFIFLLCVVTYFVIPQDDSVQSIHDYVLFVLFWALFLFQTYKIELIDERYFIFHRVIKKTKVDVKDIVRGVDGIRYYRLYFKKGSVYLDQQIDGLGSFKQTIKRLCPDMNQEEITGKNLHKDLFGIGVVGDFLFFGFLIIALIGFICFKMISSP